MNARQLRSRLLLAVAAAIVVSFAGCAGNDHESEVPSSGDPEADRRADIRVDADGSKKDEAPKTLYERIGGDGSARSGIGGSDGDAQGADDEEVVVAEGLLVQPEEDQERHQAADLARRGVPDSQRLYGGFAEGVDADQGKKTPELLELTARPPEPQALQWLRPR